MICNAFLREHEGLARLLLDDSESGQCDLGSRLFEELKSLRDLNERQDFERARTDFEEAGRRKDLLMKEVDHRVKNSLQIVSSFLMLQAKTAGAAAIQLYDKLADKKIRHFMLPGAANRKSAGRSRSRRKGWHCADDLNTG
jgi:hypothetical protein